MPDLPENAARLLVLLDDERPRYARIHVSSGRAVALLSLCAVSGLQLLDSSANYWKMGVSEGYQDSEIGRSFTDFFSLWRKSFVEAIFVIPFWAVAAVEGSELVELSSPSLRRTPAGQWGCLIKTLFLFLKTTSFPYPGSEYTFVSVCLHSAWTGFGIQLH